MNVRIASLAALALLGSGCRLAPRSEVPPLPELPDAFAAGTARESSEADPGTETWWSGFGEPRLEAVIAEALEHNHDLAAATARLDQARAQARIAGADLSPLVTLNGNASKAKTVFVGLPIPGQGSVLTNRVTNYGVQLDVSWEADIWGRLGSLEAAALADYAASTATAEGARQSVAAQTAKAWFAWVAASEQARLAKLTVESLERSLDLLSGRRGDGLVASSDVQRAAAALAQARGALAAREGTRERSARQLQVLLGRYPDGGGLEGGARLPDAGPLPAPGVPATLLERRPDLVAARARLVAADERLDAARAALLPRLTLNGSIGRSATKAPDLTNPDLTAWSLVGGLLQPIFGGGRLAAGADLADAVLREAAESYAQSLLLACGEVESLLAIEDTLARQLDSFEAAAEAARRVSDLSNERYLAGRLDLA
ncbi:MAG TPA: TolC family protein, partial [Planctomycetes bacterium]|nr:TolC family protein [Planctomycetota bacterium]